MIYQVYFRYLQSQYNGIKDDNDIKLLLTFAKKSQNNAKVETLASNKMALLTKSVIHRKKEDINIKKVI